MCVRVLLMEGMPVLLGNGSSAKIKVVLGDSRDGCSPTSLRHSAGNELAGDRVCILQGRALNRCSVLDPNPFNRELSQKLTPPRRSIPS